jgi:uncharacterized Tic20 family protein
MSYDQPPQAPSKSGEEKIMLLATHLLGIISGFIGALVIYFVANSENVKEHAKEALNFQLTLLIAYVISGVLVFFLIGLLLLPALYVINIVFCVLAAVKANDNVLWRYPATIRFIK